MFKSVVVKTAPQQKQENLPAAKLLLRASSFSVKYGEKRRCYGVTVTSNELHFCVAEEPLCYQIKKMHEMETDTLL